MTSEMTTPISQEAMEVGCIEKRDVITNDGRRVGQVTGAYIDTNSWTVNGLLIEVNKDVIDELSLKKPMLRTAKAKIPTTIVKVVSDTVQLNVAMADLHGNLSVVT